MNPESLPAPISLKRTLTLPMVVLYGLGVTIGAGKGRFEELFAE